MTGSLITEGELRSAQAAGVHCMVSGKPGAYPNGGEAVGATDGDDEKKDSTELSNSGRCERLPMSGKKLVEVGQVKRDTQFARKRSET